MPLIHILYILGSIVAISAGVPQLRKLIQTKQSDELSLTTWTTWAAVQSISLLYAIEVKDTLYAIMCAAWIAFYIVMIVLILKYRRPQAESFAEAGEESVTLA
ncbi:hypothetical protein D3C73_21670 [compost metagenome]